MRFTTTLQEVENCRDSAEKVPHCVYSYPRELYVTEGIIIN